MSVLKPVLLIAAVVAYAVRLRSYVIPDSAAYSYGLGVLQKAKSTSTSSKSVRARIIHNLYHHGVHADGTLARYRCRIGENVHHFMYHKWGGLKGQRQPLPPPTLNRTGMLDFHVKIDKFDIRILIIGNSLGEQLQSSMEEALCFGFPVKANASAARQTAGKLIMNTSMCTTKFVSNTKGIWHEQPRIIHPREGRGMLARVFTTKILDRATFWDKERTAIEALVNSFSSYELPSGPRSTNDMQRRTSSSLLDALIFLFPSGHASHESYTMKVLNEVVAAASDIFGATSVIFLTIAWHNNISPGKEEYLWWKKNDMIRSFAGNYMYTRELGAASTTVQTVQVLDFAALTLNIMDANAEALGLNAEETRHLRLKNNKFKGLVAQACASRPFPNDPKGCLPNAFSNDGIHWCPETTHGRLDAGLLCILGCIYNSNAKSSSFLDKNQRHIDECSNKCNDKFMNLVPILFKDGYQTLE